MVHPALVITAPEDDPNELFFAETPGGIVVTMAKEEPERKGKDLQSLIQLQANWNDVAALRDFLSDRLYQHSVSAKKMEEFTL